MPRQFAEFAVLDIHHTQRNAVFRHEGHKISGNALADLLPQRSDIAPAKIIELVAKEWQTSVEALLGRDRSQKIAQPRQVAMYLMRKETDASLRGPFADRFGFLRAVDPEPRAALGGAVEDQEAVADDVADQRLRRLPVVVVRLEDNRDQQG